ncbi:MAG: hypothetical protein V4669_05790 [Pseudomonadota bacterium]|jgi:hypothetical protein
MKYPYSIRASACALALFAAMGAGPVLAQTSPVVLSDVGPAPAEERDSAGAIVLETSRVPAQRAASQMGAAPDTRSMGAGPATSRMSGERARYEAEAARIRQEEADLKRKGAASVLE